MKRITHSRLVRSTYGVLIVGGNATLVNSCACSLHDFTRSILNKTIKKDYKYYLITGDSSAPAAYRYTACLNLTSISRPKCHAETLSCSSLQ